MDRKAYQKDYYQKNKEELKRKKRIFRQRPEEKERIRKYNKEYRRKNREALKIRMKEYQHIPDIKTRKKKNKKAIIKNCMSCNKLFKPKGNQKTCSFKCGKENRKVKRRVYHQKPEVKLKQKEYYQSDGYKLIKRKYQKKRRKNDENFNTSSNIQTIIYIALQRYSKTGKVMKSKKYGINVKAIIAQLGEKPEDRNIYEKDHIIPVSWFDLNNPKEIKWAFAPENWQWLRKELNRWKSDRFILPLSIEEQDVLVKEMFPNK